mgnify:CR=1 FL=1
MRSSDLITQLLESANRDLEAGERAIKRLEELLSTVEARAGPLLEDVDFTGARGVLVNIAAGSDISLGEFSEVGGTVEEFASENATVVVGTVIDESIGDEIRVTVVATGLGGQNLQERSPRIPEEIAKTVAGDGVPDYSDFDRPTVIRQAVVRGADEIDLQADKDLDYLDIPAFLRRQAD